MCGQCRTKGTIPLSMYSSTITLFLDGSFCRFSRQHRLGFEAAAWCCIFVDVVWLFLYLNTSCWGLNASAVAHEQR